MSVDHETIVTVTDGFLRTISSSDFSLVNPEESVVRITDIAHALSMICRYGGHIPEFYSVAQHSYLVSEHIKGDEELKLQGLLHDAAEAYLGDVIAPLKPLLKDYKSLELRVLNVIYKQLDVRWPNIDQWAAIKEADNRVLATEIKTFMPLGQYRDIDIPYEPYDTDNFPFSWRLAPQDRAKFRFINTFNQLRGIISARR